MNQKILCLTFLVLIAIIACKPKSMDNTPPYEEENKPLRFLALGDSYTIGESVDMVDRWPNQLQKQLESQNVYLADPKIIAVTGWRTDELMDSILSAELENNWDIVSLLIGVNNQFQGKSIDSYKPEFEELLDKAVQLAGGDRSRVFVVSIPDYAFTDFAAKYDREKITRELQEYNAANKKITLTKGIKYFNITDISQKGLEDKSLVANDGLHPSAEQYQLWVERIVDFF